MKRLQLSLPLICGVFASLTLMADRRPNILFIFSDDHTTQSISAYDDRLIQTPNLDRLADEGALLSNAFCTTSICGPSRASILTGQHGFINGVMNNESEPFDGTRQTFPKLLRAAGYRTAIFGKWHLGSEPTGFDTWEVLPGQGRYYNPQFRTPEGMIEVEGHSTNVITDRSLEWLRENGGGEEPFLLMTQYKATHRTWMPAPEELPLFRDHDFPVPASLFDDYADNASPARYQEMEIARHMYPAGDLKIRGPITGKSDEELRVDIASGSFGAMNPEQRRLWDQYYVPENAEFFADLPETTAERTLYYYQRYIKDYLRCAVGIDRNVGRILEYLDESGLAENTIVVYSSDQGFYLGEYGWYDKRWAYDISLRMPFMIRWPGVIKPGQRREELIQAIDYGPTLLEAAGVTPPGNMQGMSFLDLLQGREREWRDYIYYRYHPDAWHNVAPHVALRSSDYKLIYFPHTDEWEFYDLANDPGELLNVYPSPRYIHVIEQMKQEMENARVHYRDTTLRAIPGTHAPKERIDKKILSILPAPVHPGE